MFAAVRRRDASPIPVQRGDRGPTGEHVVAASLALLGLLLTGCPSRTASVTASCPPPRAGERPLAPPEPPAGTDPAVRDLQQRARDLELNLIERESEIQDLKKRLGDQQRSLDGAIQDVVRAKAKLLSLESRAEAASQIAETEVALKSLADSGRGASDPEFARIRQLIEMSGKEFEKENFGGALYLAIQAKGRIQSAQTRERAYPPAGGEVVFAAPLPLKVIKRSNVREQADIASAVLVKLQVGTSVTGYSHLGEWVRVECGDGTRGWVHQSLLSGR